MIIDLSKINFGGGGGSKIKVQDVKVVTQNVDSSGAYDFQPDEGYDAMKAVKANLTIPSTPVQAIDLKTGTKFGNSAFSAVPYTLICDSGVTSIEKLFFSCQSLTTLDLSNFDTSNVTYMGGMFSKCDSLTTVKVINCDETTKNKILTQLQTDLSSYTWTLGDDGIITRSETT